MITTKKISQTPSLQCEIITLLEIDIQRYNKSIFETGCIYLDIYLGGDKKIIRDFEYSREFWNWWRMQYRLVDEVFLEKYCEYNRANDTEHFSLLKIYINMHLSIEKKIDKVIWELIEDSRDKMIQDVIKNKVDCEK
jgi:hypothetical protein